MMQTILIEIFKKKYQVGKRWQKKNNFRGGEKGSKRKKKLNIIEMKENEMNF